ncbi:response regulator [Spirosoma sp. HMF3257]|uniref:Response regulator transcription factor n=2 Tax=Spirosoma telluris TaxID=2183553 RepID=A0A327NMC4_9BACT|nr:response regulator [Spirosoma telluris]RAI75176.1 hypothetical protein HMF3257_14995 [Spirosoma telluris]
MEIIWNNHPLGLDLLSHLEKESIPVIIITNSSDPDIYRKATTTKTAIGYIVKPFHKYTLASMMEKVLAQYRQLATNTLFIKGSKNERLKLRYNELIWIEADGDYCHLNTPTKRYSIKQSMVKLLEQLDDRFIRIHNSFSINSYHLESILPSSVEIKGQVLPLGRTYRSGLIEKTNILKNRH